MNKNIYIYGDRVLTEETYRSYIYVLKILYRLQVVEKDDAIEVASNFKMFFV